ncbi:MAG: porin [Rubrivivax sp.]|nr:porin [Rubrivivax sp.]
MKKSLLALAALTAFAGAASAQSSVTLFGIVDLSAVSSKNGSVSRKDLASNQLNSNRLGFRGVEDLGGGLRAGFWIEGAMSNDDGNAAGQTWQRRSTVSLMGGFGELRLGRDYTPSFWNYTIFDPFGTNGPGSMLNIVSTLGSGAGTLVRANNTVGYFLPAMGGVYGQVQVAAGEGVAGNKYTGGRLGFAGGPVNIAVALGKTPKDGGLAADYTDKNVGGSFRMGAFTLMAQYSMRDFDNRDQKTTMIGGTLGFGASTLKASVTNSKGAQGSSARDFDAKQVAFGYQYDMSKRTALYGVYSTLDNDGTAGAGSLFSIGTGAAMTVGGEKSSGFAIGVRHSF